MNAAGVAATMTSTVAEVGKINQSHRRVMAKLLKLLENIDVSP